MPSVDGEDSGDEEVEKSPNEDENMSEDEDEEDSISSGSEDSSSDSGTNFQIFANCTILTFLIINSKLSSAKGCEFFFFCLFMY